MYQEMQTTRTGLDVATFFMRQYNLDPAKFLHRLIKAEAVMQGKSQAEVAREHDCHPVAFCEMLVGRRKWKKGLKVQVLESLGIYDFVRSAGLI